jgi:ArsR family transcriptional regulator, arsenate/arsenite/antimonite-responsive transcriptional repressor
MHSPARRIALDLSIILDINNSGRMVRTMPSPATRRKKPLCDPSVAVIAHMGPRSITGDMSTPQALAALSALGQPARLAIFRLLMRREPDGLPAGAIASAIGCPQNTISTHLAILARAGLAAGVRDGRSIIYRAHVDGMRALIDFLVTDCCAGHPDLCGFPSKKAGSRRC